MLIRRLRGLLVTIAGGALVGGLLGTAYAVLVLLVPGPKTITVTPEFPGAVVLVALLWGAVVGAMSGTAFGVLLMMAERGRGVAELRPYRVAIWGAIATAAALYVGGGSPLLVALGSGLAAGLGAVAAVLARRGLAPAVAEEIHAPPT